MATASNAGTTAAYTYNALGQRIRRATSSVTTLYLYDEAGHLAGEYTSTGALIQETVWLGDMPMATLRPDGSGGVILYYVHADHLNTPRLVTDTSNNIRWRWDSDAFGTTVPNENPSSVGLFEYNLRFPGQQYDAVVGLHYNYFRDYDSSIGKYVESDPVGLFGGTNTYAYAMQDPMRYSDLLGLDVHVLPSWIPTGNPIYQNWFITTDDEGLITGAHPGSTKPDPKQPNCREKNCPEILSGTYPYTIAPFPRNPRPNRTPIPAPLLGNDGTVPTRGPNPNNGNKNFATGIRIHPGSRRRTGSEGCLTIDPQFWDDFMRSIGPSGKVTIW